MGETVKTYLHIKKEDGELVQIPLGGTIKLQVIGSSAKGEFGGDGTDGYIRLEDSTGRERMSLDAQSGNVTLRGAEGEDADLIIKDKDDQTTIHLNGSTANVELGCPDKDGDLIIRDGSGQTTIHLNGSSASIELGAAHVSGSGGMVYVGRDGKSTIILDGGEANIQLGVKGQGGDLVLKDANEQTTIHLDAEEKRVYVGKDGEPTIALDGGDARLTLGRVDQAGDITVNARSGGSVFGLTGSTGEMFLGGANQNGAFTVRNANGKQSIKLDGDTANIALGGNDQEGDIIIRDKDGNERIRLDGETGDIKLSGADCAEEFEVLGGECVAPGDVMVVEDDEMLRRSDREYDPRVAGVVSGAGAYGPGVVLDRNGGTEGRKPVALAGKVYCRVDASRAPIRAGDLLTTSSTPGHAMKVADPARAAGAVLGKALRGLDSGTGLIPVLVSLQ